MTRLELWKTRLTIEGKWPLMNKYKTEALKVQGFFSEEDFAKICLKIL